MLSILLVESPRVYVSAVMLCLSTLGSESIAMFTNISNIENIFNNYIINSKLYSIIEGFWGFGVLGP